MGIAAHHRGRTRRTENSKLDPTAMNPEIHFVNEPAVTTRQTIAVSDGLLPFTGLGFMIRTFDPVRSHFFFFRRALARLRS